MSARVGITRSGAAVGILADGRVLILSPAVRLLLIQSLSPQDDDLRIDIQRGGVGAWETLSDTRLNVSYYNGEIVGGYLNFNQDWTNRGFRALRFTEADGIREGDRIRVWTSDVGGGCVQSTYRVTITTATGSTRQFIAGRNLSITPPAWPAGTIESVSGEMLKPNAARPWQAPGSPPIYVPNGEWTV